MLDISDLVSLFILRFVVHYYNKVISALLDLQKF